MNICNPVGSILLAGLVLGPFHLSARAENLGTVPVAAADNFEVNLGPSAHDDDTKSLMMGRGAGTAVLEHDKLTVSGTFNGLVSTATDAHVRLGAAIGVPGPILFDLAITKSASGTLMGNFTLDAKQLAALRSGRMYIQVNSEKAAEPYGNMGERLHQDR